MEQVVATYKTYSTKDADKNKALSRAIKILQRRVKALPNGMPLTLISIVVGGTAISS
jgi:hypothetical protein